MVDGSFRFSRVMITVRMALMVILVGTTSDLFTRRKGKGITQ